MSNVLYILHHSGLGDHLICNAIIRAYAEKYDKIFLNVTQSTIDNVKFMYRDINNIEFIELYYTEVLSYIKSNPDNKYLILGCTPEFFENINNKTYKSFDYGFYMVAGIPYEDRWNKFYFQRDFEKEQDIYYNRLNLKDDEDYIFIHEDPVRNRFLKYIPSGIKQIKTDDFKDIRIFDFVYTIKRAKEIHVMDSCFLALIDNMQIRHDRLFLHNYGSNKVTYPVGVKLNWNIYRR